MMEESLPRDADAMPAHLRPLSVLILCLVASASAHTQKASRAQESATKALEHAIDQANKSLCDEALPVLMKQTSASADKRLRYRALMATVRCGLGKKDDQVTVPAMLELKRDFSNDPQVLYMISQIFLEIAERASQELAVDFPTSYQALELQAETFESQEKWKEAASVYRKILETNPTLRGIHYRLGRAALSQPELPTSAEDAKHEFAEELKIDPYNAAAEFWLGELARKEGQWDDAILHFGNSAKINPSFLDALLSLATAMNSAGKYEDAIPQLERYIKMAPDDPAGHYQLAIAYARTNRKEDSQRELTLQRELTEKRQAEQNARGDNTPH